MIIILLYQSDLPEQSLFKFSLSVYQWFTFWICFSDLYYSDVEFFGDQRAVDLGMNGRLTIFGHRELWSHTTRIKKNLIRLTWITDDISVRHSPVTPLSRYLLSTESSSLEFKLCEFNHKLATVILTESVSGPWRREVSLFSYHSNLTDSVESVIVPCHDLSYWLVARMPRYE